MFSSFNTLFNIVVPNAEDTNKMMADFQISKLVDSARNNKNIISKFSGQFILEKLNNSEVKNGRRTNVA